MEASHQPNQYGGGFQASLLANAAASGFVRSKDVAIKPIRNYDAHAASVSTLLVLSCPTPTVVDNRGRMSGEICSESTESHRSQLFPADPIKRHSNVPNHRSRNA